MKERMEFCPKCNQNVQYTIRENIIKEYKGIEVNVIENIGICNQCGEDIFIMELETDNLKRLYKKYEEVTGVAIISQLKKRRSDNI
ncbi:conserved hypothetical protein [Clostridium botulinum C str. Eklund]|nr:conserved hypothetical protein [Clostridium botulinum C str. Eklund]